MSDVSACPVEPSVGYVVIRPVGPPEATAGGILLPQDWKGREKKRPREKVPRCGVVAAVAPEMRRPDGAYVECGVAGGDRVVYLTYTDTAVCYDAEIQTWHIVEQDDLLATVGAGEQVVGKVR